MPLPHSLPIRPTVNPSQHNAPSNFVPSQAAFAMRAALANPYAQSHSSHYAQAYMQYTSMPLMNDQGYTFSSTYNPNENYEQNFINAPEPSSQRLSKAQGGSQPNRTQNNGSWYQPGSARCTYKNCTFTGHAKSVEIHMMDRHLIYPPGWEKRKKRPEWDADPSLKGKTIPIQGTTLVLDSPDAIDAWIAERKKRWPSSSRIEEKKRKLDEASARGQLSVAELGLFSTKRRRVDSPGEHGGRGHGRGGRGGFSGRGRTVDSGWKSRKPDTPTEPAKVLPVSIEGAINSAAIQTTVLEQGRDDSSSSEESDGEPEVLSSKPAPDVSKPSPMIECEEAATEVALPTTANKPPVKHLPRQPKKQPHNPFTPKTSLLRNLLLPEIRMTVSNLSQAVRFLVDNDFLEGVELKPGQAQEQLIQVISTEPNSTT